MTIKELFDFVRLNLEKYDIDSPALTAGVLLCHVLHCDRAYIYTHYDEKVLKEKEACIIEYTERLCGHEPIDYIIGEREFMGYSFKVGRGVLVPRPETELLVEKCFEFAEEFFKGGSCDEVKILDLCTGSGCVAVSLGKMLKKNGKRCKVTGVDISREALKYALTNASELGVSDCVSFVKGDVFNLNNFLEKDVNIFTVISINPPYIPSGDIVKLDKKVRDYEPPSALDGGADGLDFYREIVKSAGVFLINGGLLAFEIGYDQGSAVSEIIKETNKFCDIKIYRDLAGLERVITCRLI